MLSNHVGAPGRPTIRIMHGAGGVFVHTQHCVYDNRAIPVPTQLLKKTSWTPMAEGAGTAQGVTDSRSAEEHAADLYAHSSTTIGSALHDAQ